MTPIVRQSDEEVPSKEAILTADSVIGGDLAERDRELARQIQHTLEQMNARGILSSGIAAQAVIDLYIEELRPRADIVRVAFVKAIRTLPRVHAADTEQMLSAAGCRIDQEFGRLHDGLSRRLIATQTAGLEQGFPSHFAAQKDWALGEILIELRTRLAAPTTSEEDRGLIDRIVNQLKRHWLVALVIALSTLVIALGDLIDATDHIRNVFRPDRSSGAKTPSSPDDTRLTLDTGRVSVLINGLHGTIPIAPGEGYVFAWHSRGVTACQQTSPVSSGIDSAGRISIFPGNTWYPSPSNPTVIRLVCTDGRSNFSDSAVVRLRAAVPRTTTSVDGELRRLGYVLGADTITAPGKVIDELKLLAPQIKNSQDSVRAAVLIFDAYRLQRETSRACEELRRVLSIAPRSDFSRGVDARLVSYCIT